MAPFHAMVELKQNSAGKDLNVTNVNTKAGPPNCQIGLPLNSSFLYESKRLPFEKHQQFLSMFHPLLPLLNITNVRL